MTLVGSRPASGTPPPLCPEMFAPAGDRLDRRRQIASDGNQRGAVATAVKHPHSFATYVKPNHGLHDLVTGIQRSRKLCGISDYNADRLSSRLDPLRSALAKRDPGHAEGGRQTRR